MKWKEILRLNALRFSVAGLIWLPSVQATERNFTYSYEPETMPQGGLEFEQWVTLSAGRNAAVGQEDYRSWQFRTEAEYGVTDNYTISFYVNQSQESYLNPGTGARTSEYSFDGFSLENKYVVLNPAEKAVGLALYLEPQISWHEAEIEEKLILGQRHGLWKWAFNLSQATQWLNDFNDLQGELEFSLGLTRILGRHWSLGIEARDNNELPHYSQWANTAVYVGPVLAYRNEKWWATLTVMPQVYGANFGGNPDGNVHLDLEGHERLNIRLIAGISF